MRGERVTSFLDRLDAVVAQVELSDEYLADHLRTALWHDHRDALIQHETTRMSFGYPKLSYQDIRKFLVQYDNQLAASKPIWSSNATAGGGQTGGSGAPGERQTGGECGDRVTQAAGVQGQRNIPTGYSEREKDVNRDARRWEERRRPRE